MYKEFFFGHLIKFVVDSLVVEDFVFLIWVGFDKLDSRELFTDVGWHLGVDVAVLLDKGFEFFTIINGDCDVEREDGHDWEGKFPAHDEEEDEVSDNGDWVFE